MCAHLWSDSSRRFASSLTEYIRLETEILVDVVDAILDGSGIDEKFLGVTLFALVPNTTEFMNAFSFAMSGNIALRSVMFIVSSPAESAR